MPSLRGGPCLTSLAWVTPGSTGLSPNGAPHKCSAALCARTIIANFQAKLDATA